MAELATVARPYAEALFRVAKAGNLDAWSELVSELAQVAAHPDVKAVIDSPNVTDAQLADLFLAALKSPANDEVKSFVRLAVQYGRLALLPEIAAQFHVLKNASAGVADIEITSAFALDAAQQQDLVAALERKFGKKLNPTVVVDSSLIGGVRVQVGDEVLDTSVRARLAAMHGALTA